MGNYGSDVIGVDEVLALFKEVDNVSQTVVTKAAKAGANIALRQARRDAPVDTGLLKKSIRTKAEKRKKGKKVYDIKFIGEGLAKEAKGLTERKVLTDRKHKKYETISEHKRSFYPVSQEYGWLTKSGRKVPGKKFLRNAIDENRERIKMVTLATMADELKKVK